MPEMWAYCFEDGPTDAFFHAYGEGDTQFWESYGHRVTIIWWDLEDTEEAIQDAA